MAEVESARAVLLAQAEALYFERERQALNWQHAQEQARIANRNAIRNRISFLKAVGATPWDVLDYEAWLGAYVAAGNQIESYATGAYPRALEEQPAAGSIFDLLRHQSGVELGSLEDDYYASPVIWHITQPISFEELPQLSRDVPVQLHLTQEALVPFDSAKLLWLDKDSNIRLHLDGRWQDGQWLGHPQVWNTVATVWSENLDNLRSGAGQEAK